MKSRPFINPQFAFWGICFIVVTWLAATILFELHLGWPMTSIQWIKRIIGWSVEFWLIRALMLGVQRYRPAAIK